MRGEHFRCFAVIESCLQGESIGFCNLGILFKFQIDPIERVFHRAIVEPVHQTKCEEIFAPVDLFFRQFRFSKRVCIQTRDGKRKQTVAGKRSVFDRIFCVASFL